MHTSPDVLALLALGEDTGTSGDLEHLATCRSCRAELAGLTRTADVGRRITADDVLRAPSRHVWESIHRELGFTRPTIDGHSPSPHNLAGLRALPSPPRSPVSPDRDAAVLPLRRPSRVRRFVALGVAAAVALVAGFGVGVNWSQLRPGSPVVTAQMNALPRWAGATGEAKLERQSDGSHLLVINLQTRGAAPAVEEVWLSDHEATTMLAIGKLKDGRGTFVLDRDFDIGARPVIDVSSEPVDDTDPDHSGNSIARCQLRL